MYFAHMRLISDACLSMFHPSSQAPPVSFINVLVLLASLAGSVVAAFGVLLSVLETRLGITSGTYHTSESIFASTRAVIHLHQNTRHFSG